MRNWVDRALQMEAFVREDDQEGRNGTHGVLDDLGRGIAIWFGCDDADALHDQLAGQGTTIVFPPKDGPFGRYFAFQDPFGYTITPHTVGRP